MANLGRTDIIQNHSLSQTAKPPLRHTVTLAHPHVGKSSQASVELHFHCDLSMHLTHNSVVYILFTYLYSLLFNSFRQLQENKNMHRILRISGGAINEKL